MTALRRALLKIAAEYDMVTILTNDELAAWEELVKQSGTDECYCAECKVIRRDL